MLSVRRDLRSCSRLRRKFAFRAWFFFLAVLFLSLVALDILIRCLSFKTVACAWFDFCVCRFDSCPTFGGGRDRPRLRGRRFFLLACRSIFLLELRTPRFRRGDGGLSAPRRADRIQRLMRSPRPRLGDRGSRELLDELDTPRTKNER